MTPIDQNAIYSTEELEAMLGSKWSLKVLREQHGLRPLSKEGNFSGIEVLYALDHRGRSGVLCIEEREKNNEKDKNEVGKPRRPRGKPLASELENWNRTTPGQDRSGESRGSLKPCPHGDRQSSGRAAILQDHPNVVVFERREVADL